MAKKITLPSLDIFIPSSISLNTQNFDEKDASVEYHKYPNSEIDLREIRFFPIILNQDGTLWHDGSRYILFRVLNYSTNNHKTLDSIASDLKDFKDFIEAEGIDYLDGERKIGLPTKVYRRHLNGLMNHGAIKPNTLKRRITTVCNFYEWMIKFNGATFKHTPCEKYDKTIQYSNSDGAKKTKTVSVPRLADVKYSSVDNATNDTVADGGRLHPLEKDEQITIFRALESIGNTEMFLSFLISITTGARVQTVFTLRNKIFDREISQAESEIRIQVGGNADIDTKNGKSLLLYFPRWVYLIIQTYIKSNRAIKRRSEAKHIFRDDADQYVFLTNRGTPYFASRDDLYANDYRTPPNGAQVRIFIASTLLPKLRKSNPNIKFSFHDLRATFGMNLLNAALDDPKTKTEHISKILHFVKERMGHSSLTTTELYLNYKSRHRQKEFIRDDLESELFSFLKSSND